MNQRSGRIDSGKAKRSPLEPNFFRCHHHSRKFGDNSDWRNDTAAQRASTSLPSPKLKGEDVLAIDLT
ncbi:hypothetical protein J28TS4_01040 [Paenibacillus lautus]|uniref:hypothetical protein n=1 Tax=Paenibacillus lautus TaxID=1401 RepID=UPI001B1E9D32|nr:hypothetical protein [Paenibacillus lautus]GIP01697.1 hypothetical protein J28TS4_01040 [Paenibacillus lautus]